MDRRRRIVLVVGVVAAAAASGHLMQGPAGADQQARPQAIVPLAATVPEAPTQIVAVPPAAVAAAATQAAPPPAVTSAPPVVVAAETPAEAPAPACTAELDLVPVTAAQVALALSAPCHGAERVVVRQAGLAVTAQTTAGGMLALTLPALQSPARISVLFVDGESVSADIGVPDLAQFDRFVVQFPGDDLFQLQAYAGDAEFGGAGHVSALRTGPATQLGHFITALGDPTVTAPLLAEVYTFPSGLPAGTPELRLEIEAPVTAASCGREIIGETIELAGGVIKVRELTLGMPDCDAVGDILVLPNPLAELKVATHEG